MRCSYKFLIFLIVISSGCVEKVHVGPHISRSDPGSGPQSTQLTIVGERFGAFTPEAKLLYCNVPLEITEWTDVRIMALIGAGFKLGPGELRVISSDGILSNPSIFSITPYISSLDPDTAPVGDEIVVVGTNFSSSQMGQGNSSVVFSGVNAQEVLSWSDNSIKVRVPDGAQSGTVKVVVQGLESNGVGFTVSPLILSLTPKQGPVGWTVIIQGKSFGPTQGTSWVSFNGVNAGAAQAWEDTRIVITVPPSASTGPMKVTRDGVPSNEMVFTVGPILMGLSPTSGSSGSSVLITGLGFGITQGTSQMMFGGTPLSVSSWADTDISFSVPSWADGGPNSVDVLVGNASSNALSFIVTPFIGGVWPSPAYGGQVITINGAGFGTAPGSVVIGGLNAVVSTWSQGIITAVLPQSLDPGLQDVSIITPYGVSNSFLLQVTPHISSVSTGSGRAGDLATVYGSGFGAVQGTGQILIGGISALVASWSNTQVTIIVPNAVGPGSSWMAAVAGGLWSNSIGLTVLPSLTAIIPNKGTTGTQVLLTGGNLWSSLFTCTVYFNGVPAGTVLSWAMTSIMTTVPTTASTGPVIVTIGPYSTNALSFTVTPGIAGLNPTSGAVGTSIVITGYPFGPTQGTSTVTFGGVPASVVSWSNTSIVALVPSLPAGIVNVVVTVGGEPSNPMPFTVIPYISSVVPLSAFGGATFTVTGSSFGPTQGTSTLTLGGTIIPPLSWVDTVIQAQVPVDRGGGSYPVVVTVSGISSNSVSFGVRPNISGLSPTVGAWGTLVTITGSNFGSAQGGSIVTFNGVNAGAAVSWSMSAISIGVPSGADTGPVVVTVGGQQSNGVIFTVSPTIGSLSPNQGPVGSSVIVSGGGFGSTQGTSTVTFGGVLASVISWSSTSISALVPSLPVGVVNVVVTVGGVPSNAVPFTVIPYITGITPVSAFGGNIFTVTGVSFGAIQGTSTLTLGGSSLTPLSWADTIIQAQVPVAWGGGSYPVVVNVSGFQSNTVNFGVRPYIAGITPTSGTVGTLVTLSGTNYGTTQGTSAVTFNGVGAGTALSWTMSAISISVPTGADTGPVLVTVGGQQSNPVSFTFTGTSPCQGSGGQYAMGIVPFAWNSAANPGSGTQAIGPGVDDFSVNIPIPFSFSFYGTPYTSLWASSNALIDFNNNNASYTNVLFPCLGAGCDMLSAPYWDDLITSASGEVRYGTSGISPNRTFVITWINMNYFAGGSAGTFQVLQSEGTNQIRFQYFTISTSGGTATVGLNQGDGVRYNSFTPSSLVNQTAIRFCPPSPPPPPPPAPACAGFFDNMESGTGAWTPSGFWHRVVSGGACAHPAWSPVYTWWYGQDATCNYDNGATNSGNLTLPCVSTSSTATLTFRSWEQTECTFAGCPYDTRTVFLSTDGGSTWTQVWQSNNSVISTWYQPSVPLSGLPVSGTIMLRFTFNTVDNIANAYKGWYIDDVGITQP